MLNSDSQQKSSVLLVFATFFFAIAFEFLPWPTFLLSIKPVLPLLLLIYWVLHAPNMVGFTVAFIVGILIDLSNHTYLGFNVIGCLVVVYLTTNFYNRFVLLNGFAQSLHVLIVLMISQTVVFLLSIFEGGWLVLNNYTFGLYYSSISSSILWVMLPFLLQQFKNILGHKSTLDYE